MQILSVISMVVALLATMLVDAEASGVSQPGFTAELREDWEPRTNRPRRQWRGFFVDADKAGFRNPEEISGVIATAKAANASVLIVEISPTFDCHCKKSDFPRAENAAIPEDFDPLAAFLEAAHAEGMLVLVRVDVSTLWKSATPPRSSAHAFNAHGPHSSGDERWLNQRFDGAESAGGTHYVDLGNPAVTEYIVNSLLSIQKNYDIDGISLKHIHYPRDESSGFFENNWGYSATALQRFHQESGRQDRPQPSDEQWSEWRRRQLRVFLRRIYAETFAQDSRDIVAVEGVNTSYGLDKYKTFSKTQPYLGFLQDYKTWLGEGSADTLLMLNHKDHDIDKAEFDSWNKSYADIGGGTRRRIVVCPSLYNNSVENSIDQAKGATGSSMGWVGTSYATPSKIAAATSDPGVVAEERRRLAERLRNEVFTTHSAGPGDMTWKIFSSAVFGRATIGGKTVDNHKVELRPVKTPTDDPPNEDPIVVETDGSGAYAFLSLRPGTYRIRPLSPAGDTAAKEIELPVGRSVKVDLEVP